MRRLVLCVAALAACAAGPAAADEGVSWFSGTFKQALEQATKENKVVLFDAWAEWCKYCRIMDKEVWADDALGRALAREAIAFRAEVDVNKRVGVDFYRRYNVESLPLVLVLDPRDASEIVRLEGRHTGGAILAAVDRAMLRLEPERATRALPEDSAAFVRSAAELQRAGRPDEALAAARHAIELDPTCAKDDADDAALTVAALLELRRDVAGARTALEQAAERCPKASATDALWERLLEIAGRDGGAARGKVLLRRAERFPELAAAQVDAAAFLLREQHDAAAAAAPAERAVRLAPDDAKAHGVLAEVEAAIGHLDRAVELIERAVKLDPHDPDLREARLKITLAARSR